MKRLQREPGVWLVKYHGDEMSRAGVPDILGCLYGRMFGLEVKRPDEGVVAPIQRYEMQKMANAGAKVAVVESVEDALAALGIGA